VNWAKLRSLADDGMPPAALREIAGRHGMDLPHVPVLGHVAGHSWTVHCQGCTLEQPAPAPVCRYGLWQAPPLLLDAAGLAGVLGTAARLARERPELGVQPPGW
jgi:hypothetical protein